MILETVSLQVREELWFVHDDAPAHFSINTRGHMDELYPNLSILRGGTQRWLSSDFCTLGFIESLVYLTPVENVGY